MGYKILFVLFLSIFTNIIGVSANSIKSEILLTWSVLANTEGKWYGWKLVFPNKLGVKIITTGYNPNTWVWNMEISGNFWLQNTSVSTDPSLWWVTFDVWNIWWDISHHKVILQNNFNNTFTFEWYAWSNTAGWIYFWDTWITWWKVIYDRIQNKINGCAWSQNLWWICIDNFILDTTPPNLDISVLKPFAANHNKQMNILVASTENISSVEITNWNSTATTQYSTSIFQHDFRTAKLYDIKVTDTTWNIATGTLQVVAWEPTTIFDPNLLILWGTWASIYTSNSSSGKIAENTEEQSHFIHFSLKDKYGNRIKNETNIKKVQVQVGFQNTLDIDQFEDRNIWDAITYFDNTFWLTSGILSNSWTWYTETGDYKIYFKSLAPTKAWYDYISGDNNISLNQLKVTIEALNGHTWVWEKEDSFLFNSFLHKKFSFTPMVWFDYLTQSRNFKFMRWEDAIFTGTLKIEKTSFSSGVTNVYLKHILSTSDNTQVSFQDIEWNDVFCSGSMIPNAQNTTSQFVINGRDIVQEKCKNSFTWATLITKHYYNQTFNTPTQFPDTFTLTPKVVMWGDEIFDVFYKSQIEYKIWNNTIKYSSYSKDYLNSLVNKEIKVSGLAHNNTSTHFSVLSTNSTIDYIWKLDKNILFTQIRKNVSQYSKFSWDTKAIIDAVCYYKNQDIFIKDTDFKECNTIVSDGGDIVINGDIKKISWKVRSIIAIKNGNIWGNIWITHWVSFIWSTLIADKSVISWDNNSWNPRYYTDTRFAKNQLFIKGSILSYNTIWWSSSATPKCPYYTTAICNSKEARRYDLNEMRSFIYWESESNAIIGSEYWVDMSKKGYKEAPVVVEYDNDIQLFPPKIFTFDE